MALFGAAWWSVARPPAHAGEITVHNSPTCVCCERWLHHMRRAGFRVTEQNVPDVAQVKAEHGVPDALASCHTSDAGGYVIEGHAVRLPHRVMNVHASTVGRESEPDRIGFHGSCFATLRRSVCEPRRHSILGARATTSRQTQAAGRRQ